MSRSKRDPSPIPRVIRSFDQFVEETKMLPTGDPVIVDIRDPLDRYFMQVADKHGVIDGMLSEYDGDGEPDWE